MTRAIGPHGGRLYQGTWGTAPFQSLYEPAPGLIRSLPLMPEWWLAVGALAVLSLLGMWWTPLVMAVPLLVLAVVVPMAQAWISTHHARYTGDAAGTLNDLKVRLWATGMHLAQPVARLKGRLRHGLAPWRRQLAGRWTLPLPRETQVWSEEWHAPEDWLTGIETRLKRQRAVVSRGGDYDRWDLEVRGGVLSGARLLMAVEEHGAGKQLLRFHVGPVYSTTWALLNVMLGVLTILALADGAVAVAIVLGLGFLSLVIWALLDSGRATWSLVSMTRTEQ